MKKSIQEISSRYFHRFGFEASQIKNNLKPAIKIILVIPVHDEPDIVSTLDSLGSCKPPDSPVEVILVVVNNSESAEHEIIKQNTISIQEINKWADKNSKRHLSCRILCEMKLPNKHAGVGLARKIGMDEALRRFSSIGYNGLIVCLDADCTVQSSYLRELESNFAFDNFIAGSISYEHTWKNEDKEMVSGIVQYELGLRYYVNALRYATYPFAYHTIGSSMAVSARTYALAGGMNKRKAGEDFYFLHKLIPLGNFKELNSCTVYPSSRISRRVPFGTGRAMLKWKEQAEFNKDEVLKTYRFEIFKDLKELIQCLPSLRACVTEPIYQEEGHGTFARYGHQFP